MQVEKFIQQEFMKSIVPPSPGFRPGIRPERPRISASTVRKIAAPFDFERLQNAIDQDLDRVEANESNPLAAQYARKQREEYHQERLQMIVKQYATRLRRMGFGKVEIEESQFFDLQRELKQSAASECDVYPCEKSEDGGRGRERGGGYREI